MALDGSILGIPEADVSDRKYGLSSPKQPQNIIIHTLLNYATVDYIPCMSMIPIVSMVSMVSLKSSSKILNHLPSRLLHLLIHV